MRTRPAAAIVQLVASAWLIIIACGCAPSRDGAVARPQPAHSTAVPQRDHEQTGRAPIGATVSKDMLRRYANHGWPEIEYTIALEQPQTQTVQMSMRIDGAIGDELDVHLPTWRPGKYLILDQAGSIRTIHATDGSANPLRMKKLSKSHWRVFDGEADTVVIDYEIFANSIGDRTRHVDDTHAYLSGESVFVYVPELLDRPLTVRVEAPDDWRVSTGLPEARGENPDDARVFTAPNYDMLVDSPFEIGLHDRLTFDVSGKLHEIIIWGDARYDDETLISDFKAIVDEQLAVFGSLPYDKYVFMIHVGSGLGGGTEHVNSTIMQTTPDRLEGSFDDTKAYQRFLGLVSHEMFHTWDVKSFRPAGLSPYDYQLENYTTLLWLVEGTTSYYDDLTLARSELISEKNYFNRIASQYNTYLRRPGRQVQSLAESSFDSWIKYNKPTADSVNATVSFYRKGSLVSLLLDMRIREATNGRASLDDVMRILYEQFPRSTSGYTEADVLRIVENVSGTDVDAFFDDYIYGTKEVDLNDALHVVGLEAVRKAEEDEDDDDEAKASDSDEDSDTMKANLGMALRGNRVRYVYAGEPASLAGIVPGDEIVAIDGRRLDGNLQNALKLNEPGHVVVVTFFRRGQLRTKSIELGSRPVAEWTVRKIDNPTDGQRAMYEHWLGLPHEQQ